MTAQHEANVAIQDQVPGVSPAVIDAPRIRSARLTQSERSLRAFVAVILAGAAGVHAGLVPAHLVETGPRVAAALAASAVVLAVLAGVTRSRAAAPWAPAASALVLIAIAGAYLLSRTTGLPGLIPDPEPLDLLGVLTSAAETLGAVAGTILFVHARKGQS